MLGRVLAATLAAASAPPQSPSLCPAAIGAIDASATKTLAQGSPGMIVAVAHRGRPILVKGYGLANIEHGAPVIRGTVFRLASVTKQFTAAAILRLEEEGRLSLDDRLSVHVPELAQARDVTLRHLLTQTSGIPDYAEDPAGHRTKSVAKSGEDMLAWIRSLQPAFVFEPGTRWAYSNSNYVLLGVVLERVERKPLAEIFRDRLFVPAGLTDTAFDEETDVVPHRASGYRLATSGAARFRNAEWISHTGPGAAGGLRTTADDLLRWSHALFGGRILKPASLQRMVAPGLLRDGRTTKLGMPIEWQKGLNADYGMGVFITPSAAGRRIWHSGDIDGFSTWLAHYPERDLTIALMINSDSADMDKEVVERAALEGLSGC